MYLPVPSFEAIEQFLVHAEVIILRAGLVIGASIFVFNHIKHKIRE